MKNRCSRFVGMLLAGLSLVITPVMAGQIDRAFQRLLLQDYFCAKGYFEKALKRHRMPAAFGLSLIYVRNNNPFFNPDSARKYVLIAQEEYLQLTPQQQQRWMKWKIDLDTIIKVKAAVCQAAFQVYVLTDESFRPDHFLNEFGFCPQSNQARSIRHSKAFEQAFKENTAAAYYSFLQNYPEAEQVAEAEALYHQRLFEEHTASRSLTDYENFIRLYPASPYRQEAERMIYLLYVAMPSVNAYHQFIRKYPDNLYVADAWRNLYTLYMKDFDERMFEKFKQEFPDYPFMDELEEDYRLQRMLFLPFEERGGWGYMSETGRIMIAAQYEETTPFSEGLAAVQQQGKFGYINKKGKVVIPFEFEEAEPFFQGTAVVSMNGKFGLINRSGTLLIPAEYDEISPPSEGIAVVIRDGLSGYLALDGRWIVPPTYDMAGDFHSGLAIVQQHEQYGVINMAGRAIVPLIYDQILFCSNGLLRVRSGNKWGLINADHQRILPFDYTFITDFYEGRALAFTGRKAFLLDNHGKPMGSSFIIQGGETASLRFREGLLVFRSAGRIHIIDTSGKVLPFPSYEAAGYFSEGLLPVKKNNRWGYADRTGKLKIPCRFESALPFNQQRAIVRLKKNYGMIDTTGRFLIAPIYSTVEIRKYGVVVNAQGLLGLYDLNGKKLLEPDFDKFDLIENHILIALKDDRVSYFNLQTEQFISVETP